MRALRLTAFALLLAATAAPLAAGVDEWTRIGRSARIVNLEIAPGAPAILFAVAPDIGLFRRSQGQGSRPAFRRPPLDYLPGGLAIDPVDPANVYVGLSEKIARSTDSGSTWTIHSGLTCILVQWIEVDPRQPSTLYAGGSLSPSCGFPPSLCLAWKSTDSGLAWSCLREGLRQVGPGIAVSYPRVSAFAVVPQDSSLYAVVDSALYRSTDGGVTWSEVSRVTTTVFDFEIDPGNPSILYVGGGTGILRSTNGGRTWKLLRQGFPRRWDPAVSALAIDPARTTTLYAATLRGEVYKSEDSGETWVWVRARPGTHTTAFDVEVDPFDLSTLYVGTERGVMALTQSDRR
ncbi:MAG TPA: hypothetical protein VMW27_28275 [Thermoanaerobaculia bacterium]|nr:hypothetical protein [Thermoanaerobaculia bacterium]